MRHRCEEVVRDPAERRRIFAGVSMFILRGSRFIAIHVTQCNSMQWNVMQCNGCMHASMYVCNVCMHVMHGPSRFILRGVCFYHCLMRYAMVFVAVMNIGRRSGVKAA